MSDRLFSLEQQISQAKQQAEQGLSVAQDYEDAPQMNRLLALEQSLDLSRQFGYSLSEVESKQMDEVGVQPVNSAIALQMGGILFASSQTPVESYKNVFRRWDEAKKSTKPESQDKLQTIIGEINLVLNEDSYPNLDNSPSNITITTIKNASGPNNTDVEYWLIRDQQRQYKIWLNEGNQLQIAPYALTPLPVVWQQVLEEHNAKRRLHGITKDLVWDQALSKTAAEWAKKLVDNNLWEHNPNTSAGENIGKWSEPLLRHHGWKLIVQDWYDENVNYNYATGKPIDPNHPDKNKRNVGHFTQVVWKSSERIGCGLAQSSNGDIYVVCNYDPPGNVTGKHQENVPQRLS